MLGLVRECVHARCPLLVAADAMFARLLANARAEVPLERAQVRNACYSSAPGPMTSCAMPLLCSTGKPCRYSTAFPLIYVGHLRGRSPSRTHDQIFVACAILQSSYTLVWDMVMDWGLAQQVN